MREIRYQTIADDLRRRVEAGEFAAGRLLPSEAELSAAYAASRVTVRKALEVLRDEGLVDARQGFGWFVAGRPAAPVARPARHDRGAAGRLGRALRAPDPRLRLRRRRPPRVAPGARRRTRCCEVRRLNLADGEPFARVTVWCPEDLGAAALPGRRRASRRSTSCSTCPLGGAVQTIGAALASPDDAELLEVPVGLAGAALRAHRRRP